MRKPRLLYVVTEDWAFLSNRLPMARAARDAGFEVHVATRIGNDGDAIRAEGFIVHHVPFARGQVSPLAALRSIVALRQLHLLVEPDIAHHVSLMPTVLGSLAALDRDLVCINALTGFGFTFTSSTARARVLRPVLSRVLRLLLSRPRSQALVQNPDDYSVLRGLGVDPEQIGMIEGSGVDTSAFAPMPEPEGPVTIGFVGRLLRDKGIHVLVDAHRRLRSRGHDVRLAIAGFPDVANPSCIPVDEIAEWKRDPSIVMHGKIEIAEVPTFWSKSHIAALPSRREGLPKMLIEAGACGRPLVAADVPGCRSVVIPDETGLLVPADDPVALAAALETLVLSPTLRARMGAAARALTQERFSDVLVASQILDLYAKLTRRGGDTSRAA